MKTIPSSLSLRTVFALVAIAVILTEPDSYNAQNRKPFPSPSSEPVSPDSQSSSGPNYRSANRSALELGILMSRRAIEGDLERQRRRAAAQLAEDLERLEQINTAKIVPLASSTQLDYKQLAHATGEIKARATRIKFYSPLTLIDRTGEKIRCEDDASQLGPMLSQLRRTVTRFVGNPVFRISSPNDAELRSAAAHDLDGIIKLSNTINKIAKRLDKSLAKN
jgi:hypothetical protein